MKSLIIFFVTILSSLGLRGQDLSSARQELDNALLQKEHFADIKRKKIAAYKKEITPGLDLKEEYGINEKLYEQYRKFYLDSAIYYINRNISIGNTLNNGYYRDHSSIQLANLYSSKGNFLESQSLLDGVTIAKQPNDLKALYYEFYSQFYEHYTTNNPSEHYAKQIEVYRDSLLQVLNPDSNKYKINLAQQLMYKKDYLKARELLEKIENSSTVKDADYAMYVYLLGDIYMREDKQEEGVRYYCLAAVTDIENGIRDHGAIQNLAIYYYYQGKIDLAYKYAQSALADAVACNVKFRTLMMSEFYSIINASYQEKENASKSTLRTYLILISILSFFLIIAVVYVYSQMRRISKVKEELLISGEKQKDLNIELKTANQQLQVFNSQLHESNRVKEEYIAQFFDICSSYIAKLDDYRKKLNKKAMNKQFDELSKILKSSSVTNEELHELYERFDTIFINLYPNFVSEFNDMLLPHEKIELKPGELLNAELRIFALERLGISDAVKIASFLRYSLSTIYNYRTKVRNKVAVSREEFDERLKTIG
ncbi:hypothetical protein Q763_11245 [Flavobacterium beibuense F44-8]|uniref:DUF6377 domain-containing protein n=1 Tax=Flavobacterium beibuense F44-8 TaxID=1406840 RepID=A0A0A2LM31_9FLAO|nr:DUF6377 domain-containing protein [Flavobacterium beibuense]KGO80228.1 hypothetical protein Q763_11245 [Flavobacterium beibuense F44-8]